MSSYIVDVANGLETLSSTGLVGGVLDFLGDAGSWADALSKLIGLVA